MHAKYPKIGQFRDALAEVVRRASHVGDDEEGQPVYRAPARYPALTAHGTVKLHGTNASVVWLADDTYECQSRNRIITPESDNNGFAAWAFEVLESLIPIFVQLKARLDGIVGHDVNAPITIFGEWAGGNIQGTDIGLSKLPRAFYVFAAKAGDAWLPMKGLTSDHDEIRFIQDYGVSTITVDFQEPEAAVNDFVRLTSEVEARCPVAFMHGADGIGEGMVWRFQEDGYGDIMFKVKGDKHSKSRVRVLAPVDAELMAAVREVATKLITEERLEQGWSWMREMGEPLSVKGLGVFLGHVVRDALAEEKLTLEEHGLTGRDVGKPASDMAKQWFFAKLDSEARVPPGETATQEAA